MDVPHVPLTGLEKHFTEVHGAEGHLIDAGGRKAAGSTSQKCMEQKIKRLQRARDAARSTSQKCMEQKIPMYPQITP